MAHGQADLEGRLPRADTRGRGRLLALVAVLMVALLAGVLWISGMNRHTADADIGSPTYRTATNAPSDTAAGQTP